MTTGMSRLPQPSLAQALIGTSNKLPKRHWQLLDFWADRFCHVEKDSFFRVRNVLIADLYDVDRNNKPDQRSERSRFAMLSLPLAFVLS